MVNAVGGKIGSLLAIGLLFGVSGAALADVKAGVDAWATGDFATAVREWQGPADAGDADAQFNLAQAYKLGRGVPRDLTRAEALYASAAGKGHLQASDNYGLLLFQRGERAKAMPYVRPAAARGDARAQYILGLAMFNGDTLPKDWVRAYALVSLAQQAGLPQATSALKQMDEYVSMADRQKAVPLATQIAAEAEATRVRQVAAVDLGGMGSGRTVSDGTSPASTMPARPMVASGPSEQTVERAVTAASRAAGTAPSVRPVTSGTSYSLEAGGATQMVNGVPTPCTASNPCVAPPVARYGTPALSRAPAPPPPRRTVAAPAAIASGPWRLQLGAFGVAGNAEALWAKLRARPELAGHGKLLIPAGKLTRLQATGFASQADANTACARLKAGGFTCLATRD